MKRFAIVIGFALCIGLAGYLARAEPPAQSVQVKQKKMEMIASFSSSDSTHRTMTSVYRSPVAGSTASGRGLRKNRKLRPLTW